MKNNAIQKRLEISIKKLQIERDKLRTLIDDAKAVEESCIEAIDSLETAADALSKYL